MNNHRKLEFDIIRAIGIIWIVCFWHLSDYVGFSIGHPLASWFTDCIMASFFFISGLLLNSHKQIKNREDIVLFTKKRIFGFFIPFVASIITLLPFSWFDSGKQVLLTAMGLGAFFPPMVGTLWFSSVLMFYYLIGFVFLTISSKITKRLLSIVLLILCIVLVCFTKDNLHIDRRIVCFAPIYIFSLNMNLENALQIGERKKGLIAVVSIVLLSVCYFINDKLLMITIGYISFCLFFFSVSLIISKIQHLQKWRVLSSIFRKTSIASSFAYFFHRQYFLVIRAIYKRIFRTEIISAWFSLFLLLPAFFFICYCLSVLYNKFTTKMLKKATT